MLAAGVRGGRIAETGTGCGVGAAWIASALDPAAELVTVELDPARAEAARRLLARYPNVRVLTGGWRLIAPYAPFRLLFADGGRAKATEPAALLDLLAPGGMILLDDLTPEALWPAERRGRTDPVRAFWLGDPRLAATELLTTPTTAAILATRL